MRTFDHYFGDDSIINELCKLRVKEASRRSEKLFHHRIAKQSSDLDASDDFNIFPPRRAWHAFRPKERNNRPTSQVNRLALRRAVQRLMQTEPNADWVARMRHRIDRIRSRAMSEQFAFSEPKIRYEEKELGRGEYRPIACFLTDERVIDGLTARYLRESLDWLLDSSALAFRCSTQNSRAPQHHDAIEQILKLKADRGKCALFIAECDIKGFFDCVDQNLALQSFQELIADAQVTQPSFTIDQRALRIFQAYLDCYSFRDTVRSRESALKIAKRNCNARCKWAEADLRELGVDTEKTRIGVPQGGALSCVIANVLLNSADKALRELRQTTEFSYLRYCDDMILLSNEEAACAKAFQVYQKRLSEMRLPVHPPVAVQKYEGVYKAEFWKQKSKAPYRWGADINNGEIPWIQFVGYQIRYDSLLRVKKASLKKEFRKITRTTDELLAAIIPLRPRVGEEPRFAASIRKGRASILFRLQQRFISMGAGRRSLNQTLTGPLPMSWASGFRALNGRRFVWSSLKALDRHRERQLRRVYRRLNGLGVTSSSGRSKIKTLPFYGHPFSYFGQFLRPK